MPRRTAPRSADALVGAFETLVRSGSTEASALVRGTLLASVERSAPTWRDGASAILEQTRGVTEAPSGAVAEFVERLDPASLIEALAASWDAIQGIVAARATPSLRQRRGAFYTPRPLIERVLDFADPDAKARTFCDPACGTGAFLIAAHERLVRSGHSGRSRLCGVDIDPIAVTLARLRLFLARGATVEAAAESVRDIVCADALASSLAPRLDGTWTWAGAYGAVFADGGFDAVVGNPPFQNQLELATTRTAETRARLLAELGPVARGLADSAALFVARSVQIVRPEGRVALVLPRSLLSTRDTRPLRDQLARDCVLENLYIGDGSEFEAAVQVIAVGIRRRTAPRWNVARHGPDGERGVVAIETEELRNAPTWSALESGLSDRPRIELRAAGVLGDIARVSGDFHDVYYGLRGALCDQADADDGTFPRAVTTGLVDPFVCTWGARAARHDRVARRYPRIDMAVLDGVPAMARWSRERRRPKLLVGSLGKVIEVWADAHGCALPVPPVVTVVPVSGDIWRVLAVVASPAASIWYAERNGTGALGAETLRVSAPQLAQLPLPQDAAAWDEGARLARELSEQGVDPARLGAFADAMGRAYGVGHDVRDWWMARVV